MKEPALVYSNGEVVPYSKVPSEHLKYAGTIAKDPSSIEHYDSSFRKLYAAIILRERNS